MLLKNSKATGSETQALPQGDVCSLRTRPGLEPSVQLPLCPHPPHGPPPTPFSSHLPSPLDSPAAPLKHLPASSQRAGLEPLGQTPRSMARPQATSRNMRLCLLGGPGGSHGEGKPGGHLHTPRSLAWWPFRHRPVEKDTARRYRDCAPDTPDANTLAVPPESDPKAAQVPHSTWGPCFYVLGGEGELSRPGLS